MRKRWGIWVLFVLGFLCCCLPLLAHLYSQKEQEKVIATYQKTIREQKRDVKELRKQAEHYNSILYQTNGAALSGEDALLLGDASYASLLDTTGTGVIGSLDIPKIGVIYNIFTTEMRKTSNPAANKNKDPRIRPITRPGFPEGNNFVRYPGVFA